MTPQDLKNSILQLAIQGKLVEQRAEEGTAEELYIQIQNEKQALIKEGKIKKEKPLSEITEDEIPFDIPESWLWVRLRTIVYNRGQEVPSALFSYIDIGSIDNKNQRLNAEENLIEADEAPSRARKIVESGDILYSTVRPYLHNMCIIDRQFSCRPIASTGFAAMTCYDGIYNKYLFFYLMSPAFDSYANHTENAKGVAYPAINDDRLYRAVVPLPPIAEQKRIVAKIEELLPLINRYEQAWSKLEDFNKRFPNDMQKSILQMAIQVKLVEQRPEEGTGEELYAKLCLERDALVKQKRFKGKKYPELTEEELPFAIPDTWKWVRLGDIISIESGKGLTAAQMVEGSIPVYGGNGITGYHNESFIHEETVVIGRVGFYCGSVHITEKESWVTDNAFITTYPQGSINRNFLVYMLRHMNLGRDNNATAQPVVSGKKIYPLAFPLPPLAEQKRIVARLEELLPLCERLK